MKTTRQAKAEELLAEALDRMMSGQPPILNKWINEQIRSLLEFENFWRLWNERNPQDYPPEMDNWEGAYKLWRNEHKRKVSNRTSSQSSTAKR